MRPLRSEMVVLSRKSCVTAIPMEAKARDVRSQARKVRSNRRYQLNWLGERRKESGDHHLPKGKGSRANTPSAR